MTLKNETLTQKVQNVKKHYNSENSQDYVDLMVGTMMQASTELKLRNLITAKNKPYFSRIDFNEEGKIEAEKLYIGKMSLLNDEDQEIVIVDWRAPIANLYYEERLGDAAYNCPEGNIKGQLTLKRQFTIEEGELKGIFDIDVTTNDEFLQSYLGTNADNRLKDIVSSIQSEQNKIIRSDMWTPLIIQGAAGSGKTTIALHRIAYLIYTYEKTFKPENFMIIAPNKFFLNYISEILPELGVEKVKQTTFEEFAQEIIGKKQKIKDSNEKLMLFVDNNITEEQKKANEFLKEATQFKSSMTFKEILDDYIEVIETLFIPKEDFKLEKFILFKYEEINDLFINQYKRLPIVKRLEEIKKHLTNRLKARKDTIIDQLQQECDMTIMKLKLLMEEGEPRKKLIIEAIDKKNDIVNKFQKYAGSAVKEYIAKISKLNALDYYKDLISNEALFNKLTKGKIDRAIGEFLRDYTNKVLSSGFVDIEDFAPIVYLKYKIHGVDEKIDVKQIIIDEAQDFSVFQLYVLKKIINSSFTIFGDLSQGIHSYRGIKDWNDVKDEVFDGKSNFLTLEQSYRTTIEITESANMVISKLKDSKLILSKPVFRHGEKVRIIKCKDIKEIVSDMEQKMKEFKDSGYKSIAIVCKNLKEGKELLKYFKNSKDGPHMITGEEKEYKGGVVIVPSYLAKGLEFDVVMIANAGKQEYGENELDIKLLYVSMTRSLHKLYVYYQGELSQLLRNPSSPTLRPSLVEGRK
ncbi:MAG TPA: DNA helicase [Lachnospiraceae bacterium]|nr:DNA helicase [Lachnospiraceae bacterium]